MRRAMQMFLTRGALERYLPIQRAEAVQLMYDILKQPEVSIVLFLYQRQYLSCRTGH